MTQKGERGWKGEELGGHCSGGSRWVWATTASHSGALPPFTDLPENPVPPQIAKLLAWHLFLQSFLCRWVWRGEVGCVGLQASGSPGGCLGDDWRVGKHTNPTLPFAGRSAGPGVGNWKIRVSIFI